MIKALVLLITLVSCIDMDNKELPFKDMEIIESDTTGLRYLALGDSYTIGQSVSEKESFPYQLIHSHLENPHTIQSFKIIAKTGWTTRNLLDAMDKDTLVAGSYDFITLLIGVNNQYQGKPFSQYEEEYNELMDRAIALLEGNATRLIVVSIPDYSVTPFAGGGNTAKISKEVKQYNDYNAKITKDRGSRYVYITDLTQNAKSDLTLLADDKLHPSGKNYGQWVSRIVPVLNEALTK